MIEENKINWELLAKYLDDETTDEEKIEIEKCITSDPAYGEIFVSVKKPWDLIKRKEKMIEVNTDEAWNNLKNRIESDIQARGSKLPGKFIRRSAVFRQVLRIAAALVLVAGVSYSVYRLFIYDANFEGQSLIVKADAEQILETQLPDGSEVVLNKGSKLEYIDENTGIRSVTLEGEGYFNVRQDPHNPFIIKTGDAVIKVVGTAFSVFNNIRNNTIEVFVEEGTVHFSHAQNESEAALIEAGYIGIIQENRLSVEKNPDINYLAWKTRKLVFQECPVDDVINSLNHTYGSNIVHGDTKISEFRFTGTFYNQPLDSVLYVMKTAFNLEIEISKSQIVLTGMDDH